MNPDRLSLLLLSAATFAAVFTFAMVATDRRRRERRTALAGEDKANLHAWENEGGNVVPVVAEPASP